MKKPIPRPASPRPAVLSSHALATVTGGAKKSIRIRAKSKGDVTEVSAP